MNITRINIRTVCINFMDYILYLHLNDTILLLVKWQSVSMMFLHLIIYLLVCVFLDQSQANDKGISVRFQMHGIIISYY